MGEAGFEPAKALPPDLQSGPVGRLGIPPCVHKPRFEVLRHWRALAQAGFVFLVFGWEMGGTPRPTGWAWFSVRHALRAAQGRATHVLFVSCEVVKEATTGFGR